MKHKSTSYLGRSVRNVKFGLHVPMLTRKVITTITLSHKNHRLHRYLQHKLVKARNTPQLQQTAFQRRRQAKRGKKNVTLVNLGFGLHLIG